MANDRRYKRYFIILENEDRGFEKTDKGVPKGYAKIEVRNGKGLLNVYVQDLKYFKDAKYIYRNYLISTKGEKSVYVDTGSFVIDERGKGELKVKFNPDDVEGSGKTIEDFNVVAVIARPIERSSEKIEIFGPLVGYMDKEKVNWKDVLIYEEKKKAIDNNLDKEYKQKYEDIIDAIEKSSKEIYKEDAKENKENKENKDNKKKEEYKGKKKEYDKDHYDDEECAECVDSLKKYENKKMKEKKDDIKADNKKQPQKENVYTDKKTEKKEEIKEEKKESEKQKANPYKKQDDYKEKKTVKKDTIKDEKKEDIKEEKKEEKKDEYKKENDKKDKTKKEDSKSSFDRKPDVHYKKYHKMVYKYVKDMLKYYEKIEPFEKDITGYSWWKMQYDKQSMHRGFLPFFGYILNIYYFNPYIYYMNNCENLMNKYGHYIFGISYDKDTEPKYYVYGVPGRYMHKDQPFQGMTGFIYWVPLEDKKPEQGDYGYWLLHIDAKTGNVIFPVKPKMPGTF